MAIAAIADAHAAPKLSSTMNRYTSSPRTPTMAIGTMARSGEYDENANAAAVKPAPHKTIGSPDQVDVNGVKTMSTPNLSAAARPPLTPAAADDHAGSGRHQARTERHRPPG